MLFCDRFQSHSLDLSQNCLCVVTIVSNFLKKVWNESKVIVSLQCQKSTKRLATDKEIEF
jgi:hypothetical protein